MIVLFAFVELSRFSIVAVVRAVRITTLMRQKPNKSSKDKWLFSKINGKLTLSDSSADLELPHSNNTNYVSVTYLMSKEFVSSHTINTRNNFLYLFRVNFMLLEIKKILNESV